METISLSRTNTVDGISTNQWLLSEVVQLFEMPLMELIFQAQSIHRQFHKLGEIQLSTLLSIKTGGCPEDCSYCPQSSRYTTGVEKEKLMAVEEVIRAAKIAKEQGASRFCMGAAWRGPKQHQIDVVSEMVRQVKSLGMETCVTLGMLKDDQAEQLKEAGLDYYNHNIDTAPEFYGNIINTRSYQDRLDTLERVRNAGINVCCGGIVGLGESRRERAGLLTELANMTPPPQSVPINHLVKVAGTPLANEEDLDPFEFIRTIAIARILMPSSKVRLSAGREQMDESTQALCFLAGVNSIFYGDCLLTTSNPQREKDQALFQRLDLYSAKV